MLLEKRMCTTQRPFVGATAQTHCLNGLNAVDRSGMLCKCAGSEMPESVPRTMLPWYALLHVENVRLLRADRRRQPKCVLFW